MRFLKPAYSKWSVSLGILLLPALLPRCMTLHMSDKKVKEYFEDAPEKPSFYEYTLHGRRIHYAAIGADTLPMVVFVHGSPGSWDAFISFFKDSTLHKAARIVSVDRPGFGKSGYGNVETSLKEQASLLMPILQTSKAATRPLLVGHSLGGPVVSRIAMDYPTLVGGLVLVAPSIDPALEKWEWYRHIGDFFLFRAIIPKELDVSNQEILPLKKELTTMLPMWASIRVPVSVIQGEKDKLVPPGNADFARKMLVNAPVKVWMIPNMNHFIPWSRPDLIREVILLQLNYM
jgi:pimeloyl-ACP methyl ester carboxylesterase